MTATKLNGNEQLQQQLPPTISTMVFLKLSYTTFLLSILIAIASNSTLATAKKKCDDDPANWHEDGFPVYNCGWYTLGDRCLRYGDSYKGKGGKTANQACCTCGGGRSKGSAPTTRYGLSVPQPTPPVWAPTPVAWYSLPTAFVWPPFGPSPTVNSPTVWVAPIAPTPTPVGWPQTTPAWSGWSPLPTSPSWVQWFPPPPPVTPTLPTSPIWAIQWLPPTPSSPVAPPPPTIPSWGQSPTSPPFAPPTAPTWTPPVAPPPVLVPPVVSTTTTTSGSSSSSEQQQQQWLQAHNSRRQAFHSANGVSYVPLQWSTSLAQSAQQYTQKLLDGFADCHIEHNYLGDTYGGENLAAAMMWKKNTPLGSGPPTPEETMTAWFDNEEHLPYPQNGHRTQVAWRATHYVGCATGSKVLVSPTERLCYIQTCRYLAPGNCNGPTALLATSTPCGPQCPADDDDVSCP